MWLSLGDLGTGVNVGSPNINLSVSDQPSNATGGTTGGGFDWSSLLKSPFFYAAIVIVLFAISRRK